MPRTSRHKNQHLRHTRSSSTTSASSQDKLLARPQTILGLVLLLLAACISISFAFTTLTQDFQNLVTPPSISTPATLLIGVIEPQSLLGTPSAATSAAQQSTQATQVQQATPAAQALKATPAAQTTTALRIKVKKDQTFWELAKRYCGSHTSAEELAARNGYRRVSDLKEGDVITILCK